jgi:hypothetical protein
LTPTALSCAIGPWLTHLSFVIILSALLLKTYRLWRVSSSKTLYIVHIPDGVMLRYFGVVLGSTIVYLTVWTILDPWDISRVVFSGTSYIACSSVHDTLTWRYYGLLFFEWCMIIAGVVLCIVTRNVPSAFNESKWIAAILYTVSVISILSNLLIYAPLNNDPRSSAAIKCISIAAASYTQVVLFFVPKWWRIRTVILKRVSPMGAPPTPLIGGPPRHVPGMPVKRHAHDKQLAEGDKLVGEGSSVIKRHARRDVPHHNVNNANKKHLHAKGDKPSGAGNGNGNNKSSPQTPSQQQQPLVFDAPGKLTRLIHINIRVTLMNLTKPKRSWVMTITIITIISSWIVPPQRMVYLVRCLLVV